MAWVIGAVSLVAACETAPAREQPPRIVDPAQDPYVPATVTDGGRISGVVAIKGARPADSVVAITGHDTLACGRTTVAWSVAGTGDGLGGALVWLADIRRGRALPLERRHELVMSRCTFEPRLLAVPVASVVNVFNEDRALHRVTLRRMGDDDTLAVLPFYNSGQVVPSRHLAQGMGLVELRCGNHEWSRAYVAAFDHPYFTVTGMDGSFRMDSVPPGRYRLHVWHERLELPVVDSVTVEARSEARAAVRVPLVARDTGQ